MKYVDDVLSASGDTDRADGKARIVPMAASAAGVSSLRSMSRQLLEGLQHLHRCDQGRGVLCGVLEDGSRCGSVWLSPLTFLVAFLPASNPHSTRRHVAMLLLLLLLPLHSF
jgi:hypothetical protein